MERNVIHIEYSKFVQALRAASEPVWSTFRYTVLNLDGEEIKFREQWAWPRYWETQCSDMTAAQLTRVDALIRPHLLQEDLTKWDEFLRKNGIGG